MDVILDKQRQENVREIKEDPRRACKLSNKLFNKNNIQNVEKHVIAYIGEKNMIGVDDVRHPEEVEEFGKYSTTVKCISKEAHLMFLYKKDFMVLKQQSTTWSILAQLQDKTQKNVEQYIKKTQKARAFIDNNFK